MIWLGIALLAALTLAPLGLALRGDPAARGRREAALALHRAQLDELDRDRAGGLIAPEEHAGAKLELERRLLAAAQSTDSVPESGSRLPLVVALAAVPLAGLALYLTSGHPSMPGEPLASRIAAVDQAEAQGAELANTLRAGIAGMDPTDPRRREGFLLLGQVEARMGHMGQAAAAWRSALSLGFAPEVALEAAEAETEAAGRVTPEAAALFRRALAAAPADAPWRQMAEARIAESEHER